MFHKQQLQYSDKINSLYVYTSYKNKCTYVCLSFMHYYTIHPIDMKLWEYVAQVHFRKGFWPSILFENFTPKDGLKLKLFTLNTKIVQVHNNNKGWGSGD